MKYGGRRLRKGGMLGRRSSNGEEGMKEMKRKCLWEMNGKEFVKDEGKKGRRGGKKRRRGGKERRRGGRREGR